jgi:hypothetical protein
MSPSTQLAALVDELLKKSAEAGGKKASDYTKEAASDLNDLRQGRSYWSIAHASAHPESLDRRGHILGGAPFTSELYPWPRTSGEVPYIPLVQINLTELNRTTGRNVGEGLLQVWLDVTDDDLPNLLRVVPEADAAGVMTSPEFDHTAIDPSGSWGGACLQFSVAEVGFMCRAWDGSTVETRSGRDLSPEEDELIGRIIEVTEAHNYRRLRGDWIFGYPDMGSGAPAGKYDPIPENLFQFKTSAAFPMAAVSRYANVFFEESGDELVFFFDWNG